MKIRPEQAEALGAPAPCQFAPIDKDAGERGSRGSPGAKSVIIVDPTKLKGFIGIELVDSDQKPVPNAAFVVTLPDGTPVSGTLDQNGKARIEGIDPGECKIVFPAIDRRDFV